MPAQKISIEKAKKNKLFYFVANVVVYRDSDKRCLILKRSDTEIVHPGRYGVVGGKLEWEDMDVEKPSNINGDVLDFNDAVETLLVRETMEEAGLEIHSELKYINSKTFIRPDEVPVVLVKFTAKYKSGEVSLEENAFSEYAWVNGEEVSKYECIDGIQEEVTQSISLWNS
ncbi:MAG: NUDIX domain-containing protein [Patescibacteria group bacterium]